MSRQKGSASEREVFKIIEDRTGIKLMRNLDQYQKSDSDAHVLGFCIEIKRQEVLSLRSWWEQVCVVAEKQHEIPCLIYRQNRQPWRVVLPLASMSPMLYYNKATSCFDYTCTILLEPLFTTLLSECLAGESKMVEQERERLVQEGTQQH